MTFETLEAVVLAAGRSTRMGVPKLHLPFGGSGTVLEHLLRSLLVTSVKRVVVVAGHRANLIREELKRRFGAEREAGRLTTVLNPEYERGMAHSLRAGVQSLESSTTGALLVVGDQPLVGSELIRSLISNFRRRGPGVSAVSVSAGGELRNPALVDESFFASILQLEGDRGAKPLLERRDEEVQRIEREEGLWGKDVDSWELYERLIRRSGMKPESGGEPSMVNTTRLPPNWKPVLEEKRSRVPPPLLAPGVLLLDLGHRRMSDWEPLPLPVRFDASLPARGEKPRVEHVVAGPARTAGEYLELLRTAAVWCLNR